MIPNKKSLKTLKMTKTRKLWCGAVEETCNPFVTPKKRETIYTVCFKLPVEFQHIETIAKDGKVVWENEFGVHVQTGAVGGGGRWWLRRKWLRGTKVAVEIEFRDIPYAGNEEPKLEITLRI